MIKHILPAVKLTALCIVLLAVVYPALVFALAQLSPNQGRGKTSEYHKKSYYSNIGQAFTEDQYFWSRPSAVDYNAAASGGSNKGPSNKEYLKQVQSRIDAFMLKNPTVSRSEIPADLVTASGSGLDPNFSVQSARVQVKRISKIRKIDESVLHLLIGEHTEKPLLGVFGPEKINILKLNIALDQITRK